MGMIENEIDYEVELYNDRDYVGLGVVKESTQALANHENDVGPPLNAVIAARLALDFAEEWDCQQPSSGIDHINPAKGLIRQAYSQISSFTYHGGGLVGVAPRLVT